MWHQVGLSLFNCQDDAQSDKHKIQNIHVLFDNFFFKHAVYEII